MSVRVRGSAMPSHRYGCVMLTTTTTTTNTNTTTTATSIEYDSFTTPIKEDDDEVEVYICAEGVDNGEMGF